MSWLVLAAIFKHPPLVLPAYLRKEGVLEASLQLLPHNFELAGLASGKVDAASMTGWRRRRFRWASRPSPIMPIPLPT